VIELVNLVWAARGLDAREKLVLLRIADRVNDKTGVAYPSIPSIADDCSLSERGVIKIVNRLRDAGYLEVLRGIGRRTSRYRVIGLSRGEPGSPLNAGTQLVRGEPRSPLDIHTANDPEVNLVPVEVNRVPSRGEPGSPGTIKNHQEPKERTGAHAPACALREPPFRVYAAIARKALARSIREDGDESSANACEIFKRMCAEQGLNYAGEIARKAMATAFHRRSA